MGGGLARGTGNDARHQKTPRVRPHSDERKGHGLSFGLLTRANPRRIPATTAGLMRLLFLGIHPIDRSPGQRYRFEQYLPALRAAGVNVDYRALLTNAGATALHEPGLTPDKARLVVSTFGRRLAQVLPAVVRPKHDVVFVQREAHFFGPEVFEWLASRAVPMVYDFDDAIWIRRVSESNRRLSWLRSTSKIGRLIRASRVTLAGNRFLADYARRYSRSVLHVPTVVDTDRYTPGARPLDGPIAIGWSGSFSTSPSLGLVLPAFRRLRRRFGDRVSFRVLGDPSFTDEELGIRGIRWSSEGEVGELQAMDIGVMPLEADEWSRGKCGLKSLLYMATGNFPRWCPRSE